MYIQSIVYYYHSHSNISENNRCYLLITPCMYINLYLLLDRYNTSTQLYLLSSQYYYSIFRLNTTIIIHINYKPYNKLKNLYNVLKFSGLKILSAIELSFSQ